MCSCSTSDMACSSSPRLCLASHVCTADAMRQPCQESKCSQRPQECGCTARQGGLLECQQGCSRPVPSIQRGVLAGRLALVHRCRCFFVLAYLAMYGLWGRSGGSFMLRGKFVLQLVYRAMLVVARRQLSLAIQGVAVAPWTAHRGSTAPSACVQCMQRMHATVDECVCMRPAGWRGCMSLCELTKP